MPTFTIELHKVIEYYGTSAMGLDDYPIYDEKHRGELNKKIVDRFYNREIGVETPELFFSRFKRKMNEIMPYYNELYKTTALEFDPLITNIIESENDSTQTQTQTNESNSEASATTTSGSRNVTSDTPQTMLRGSGDYASAASDVTGDVTATNTGRDAGESSASVSGTGKSRSTAQNAPASQLIQSWRAMIINVDIAILDELEELFMQVWNTSDNYTQNNYWPYPLFATRLF